MNEASNQTNKNTSVRLLLKLFYLLLLVTLCYGLYQVLTNQRYLSVYNAVHISLYPTNRSTSEKSAHDWVVPIPDVRLLDRNLSVVKDDTLTCQAKPSSTISLEDAVNCHAADGVIAVASFDVTYASMALNLYLTSFKRFNITNHLFVASDAQGCGKLKPYGANCVQYANMSKAPGPSIFNSVDYNIKANIKPRLVLDCLKIGVAVLLVDLDIVFLKNPLPLVTKCKECDFISHIDPRVGENMIINSGFFLVRPTDPGIQLFERVVKMITKKPTGDQVYVNRALREMKKKNLIKEQRLDYKFYPDGLVFFGEGHRLFIGDNPCKECVIVHNNYIVSVEAKRYRFMEYGLWAVDEDGYYSNKDRKYIQFDNPIDFVKQSGFGTTDTRTMELKSLRFALTLGHILNRTVIMPRFHCTRVSGYTPLPNQLCHFGTHYCIRKFESFFPLISTYRENVFLKHPLIPESIKTSVSKPFVIDSPIWRTLLKNTKENEIESTVNVMTPNGTEGVSASEIRKWFAADSHHILAFHSLYNEVIAPDKDINDFSKRLNKAIKSTNFMQIRQRK